MYEDLIMHLRECAKDWDYDTYKQAADAIENLDYIAQTYAETVHELKEQNRWISVYERLPEDGEIVLVHWWNIHCVRIDNFSVMRFYEGRIAGEIDEKKGIRFCDQWGNNATPYAWADPYGPMQLFGQDVSHWMPLPEPPKEET